MLFFPTITTAQTKHQTARIVESFERYDASSTSSESIKEKKTKQADHKLEADFSGIQHRKEFVGELHEMRNLSTKHYLNNDGTYTAILSTRPVHYEDTFGEWQDIDTTLIDEVDIHSDMGDLSKEIALEAMAIARTNSYSQTQRGIRNRENTNFRALKVPFDVSIPKDFSKGYSITKGKDTLSLIPENANKTKGVQDPKEKNSIYYSNVWPHTDVRLKVTSEGVKEDIILLNENSLSQFSYELNSKLSNEYTLGDLQLTSLWAEDRNGKFKTIEPRIVQKNNRVYYTFALDTADMEYPITIDPGVTIKTNSDTYINTTHTQNRGSEDSMSVKYDATSASTGYVKFDLSALQGKKIDSAVLKLTRLTFVPLPPDTDLKVVAGRITSDWQESSLYIYNRPSYTDVNPANYFTSKTPTSLDVTDIITKQLALNQYYGIALIPYSGSGAFVFSTKENPASLNPPHLEVSYSLEPSIKLSKEGWTNQNVTFTLSNSAATSQNARQIQYKVNSGSWVNYTSPIIISTEGTTTISARNIYTGNVTGEVVSKTIQIDKKTPADPSTNTSVTLLDNNSVKLQWKPFNDPSPSSGVNNTIIYAQEWDGASWKDTVDIDGDGTREYSKSVGASVTNYTINGLKSGHKYRFIAGRHVDKAGNHGSYTWREVGIPPSIPTINGSYLMLTWSPEQGLGSVNLSWKPVSGATGYKVKIFNGNSYESFDVGNVTTWNTRGKNIFPKRSLVESWDDNSKTTVFNHNNGNNAGSNYGEFWDNPNLLYRKTIGTEYDAHTNYWFRVSAYNLYGESAYSSAYSPQLPNRTDLVNPTFPIIIPLNTNWTNQNVEVLIADGIDMDSGVRITEYKIGNGGWHPYTSKLTIADEGEIEIYARTFDYTGRVSVTASATVKIDKTIPKDPSHSNSMVNVTPNSVKLQWGGFSDSAPSSGVKDTLVYAEEWNGTTWVRTVDIDGDGKAEYNKRLGPNATSITINNLKSGTKYRFIAGRHEDNALNLGAYTWRTITTDFSKPQKPTGTVHANEWAPQGTGYVNLSWQSVQGATGYKVLIFNGYKYEEFDVGNVTSWSTRNKFLFPVRELVDSWNDNSQTDVFNHNLGRNPDGLYGDLWDNPMDLYIKTKQTNYDDRSNYWFRISAYNKDGESPRSDAFMPVLENRSLPRARYYYDNNGRLDYMITPEGQRVDYNYDSNGNLIDVK